MSRTYVIEPQWPYDEIAIVRFTEDHSGYKKGDTGTYQLKELIPITHREEGLGNELYELCSGYSGDL